MTTSRYSRQELFAGLGRDGQERLRAARVLVVGCGALGSALCETLARAGVGELTVVDRDLVEESNLQRQSLFDEDDARRGLPKAVAAEARLRRLNSDVKVTGVVADVDADNVSGFVDGRALALDGSDNFELRYVLNDACLRAGVPWVYGACVGAHGLALLVRAGRPCLRCVLGERPAPGSVATCDTAGVIGPIVQVVAGVQAAEALKLLAGREQALLPGLVAIDLWAGDFDVLDLSGRAPSCPACTRGRYDALDETHAPSAATLCGRDAVQVRAPRGARLDLDALARRLQGAGRVLQNEHLLRFSAPEAELVVFADGRALVKGVDGAAQARSLYARYVGN